MSKVYHTNGGIFHEPILSKEGCKLCPTGCKTDCLRLSQKELSLDKFDYDFFKSSFANMDFSDAFDDEEY